MGDQEFIPDPVFQGRWVKNPALTGNKLALFEYYPVRLLRNFKGERFAKSGERAYVQRSPSGQLYLSTSMHGPVFCGDAKEGVDFEFLKKD